MVVREQKCIEPLWDSKSDYEIFALIFEKMGKRHCNTDGGKTEVDWVKGFFDNCDLPKVVSWDEFNTKGYHIININDDYKATLGLRWFYEGRPATPPRGEHSSGSTPSTQASWQRFSAARSSLYRRASNRTSPTTTSGR